jgi:hypothetical protein
LNAAVLFSSLLICEITFHAPHPPSTTVLFTPSAFSLLPPFHLSLPPSPPPLLSPLSSLLPFPLLSSPLSPQGIREKAHCFISCLLQLAALNESHSRYLAAKDSFEAVMSVYQTYKIGDR